MKKTFVAVLMTFAMVLFASVGVVMADDAEGSDEKPVKDVKFGGRIMQDWSWFDVDDNVPSADDFINGNEFRRARLFMSGTLYGNIKFKAQYDFAGGDADVKDLYMGLKGMPFGELRVGHFKVPFSLEELTSSKYITFVERSLPNMLALGREAGFAALGSSDNFTWGLGMFTDADGYGEAVAHDDQYIFAGRLTFLPYKDGNNLFHLGAGAYYKDLGDDGSVRYRQRPEAHLTPRVVDVRINNADAVTAFGLEAATVFGSFHGAAEYILAQVDSPDNSDPDVQGFYAYGGFFLTGDVRKYKGSSGAFNRTKPNSIFDMDEGGIGAWEVAARFSQLQYDEAIGDQELTNFTVALNWYLNNYTVIKFNYIYFERGDLNDATGNQFVTRFQIDW